MCFAEGLPLDKIFVDCQKVPFAIEVTDHQGNPIIFNLIDAGTLQIIELTELHTQIVFVKLIYDNFTVTKKVVIMN